MSSSFFEAQHVFESAPPLEIRLYHDKEGVILDKKYVKKDLSENKTYIVITQDQYDGINFKRHRVIGKELVWITPKKTNWFLKQEELARNPYVKY
jgi:hypothetical protein